MMHASAPNQICIVPVLPRGVRICFVVIFKNAAGSNTVASPQREPATANSDSPAKPTQHIPQVDGQFNEEDDSDDRQLTNPPSASKAQPSRAIGRSSQKAAATSANGMSQSGLATGQKNGGIQNGNAVDPPKQNFHSPIASKSFQFKKISLHEKGRKFGDKKREQAGADLFKVCSALLMSDAQIYNKI